MKTDELKPLWDAYKNRVGAQAEWSEEALLGLVKTATKTHSWYQPYQHAFLNVCVAFLLVGVTSGC